MKMKPAHLFQGGICSDCIKKYKKAAQASEDEVLRRRIAEEHRREIREDSADFGCLVGRELGCLLGLLARIIGPERYFEYRHHRRYRWLRILIFLVIPALIFIVYLLIVLL
ncbi:hypothetical protein CEE36_08270 [candidate division TA06 bacterium B3_TA06]|uniref:Uncharacterized protein n=1 Tax=candidate division TA06 bacterium B3_TA06 TaxID=2012487 RepID=A0A532V2Q2_UNCT6|nr:MAG: hypothetical protein CEE36_08270 [candidate division TA06 bacterium B3_TA06]